MNYTRRKVEVCDKLFEFSMVDESEGNRIGHLTRANRICQSVSLATTVAVTVSQERPILLETSRQSANCRCVTDERLVLLIHTFLLFLSPVASCKLFEKSNREKGNPLVPFLLELGLHRPSVSKRENGPTN